MDKKIEIQLLKRELNEYYRRMELADRYDNRGDVMFCAEVISRISSDLDKLEKITK